MVYSLFLTFRQNQDTGKYFLLEPEEGKQTEVEKNGSFVTVCINDVSGTVSFKQRKKLAEYVCYEIYVLE